MKNIGISTEESAKEFSDIINGEPKEVIEYVDRCKHCNTSLGSYPEIWRTVGCCSWKCAYEKYLEGEVDLRDRLVKSNEFLTFLNSLKDPETFNEMYVGSSFKLDTFRKGEEKIRMYKEEANKLITSLNADIDLFDLTDTFGLDYIPESD